MFYTVFMDEHAISSIRAWLGTGSLNIFGRPFAGKDTQGAILASLLGGTLLGGGDILRGSDIPPHVDAALRRGELIPSQDYVDIVLPYLSKVEFHDTPLILSSVGRWIGEETGVVEALKTAKHPLKAVIYLELDEEYVRQRWHALESHDTRGGRYDDTAEILEKRLVEYREKTLPVIAEYERRGLLIRQDGSGTPDEVTRGLIAQLSRFADADSGA